MEVLILFTLKSTVVSGILYTWYFFALKNKRLHNYNRFFLLFALYASIQIPLLNLKWSPVYENPPAIFNSANFIVHAINGADNKQSFNRAEQTTGIDWKIVMGVIIALISLGFLSALLLRIVWLLRLSKRYPIDVQDGIILVKTDLSAAPFSFMNHVFWRNNISLETENGRMILKHELVHIKQKHTYDKIACQLFTSLFWMNPFYWIIQKELCMIHEFIADEHAIVNDADDIKQDDYTEVLAKMLLHAHHPASYFKPVHQFFSSPIKRRLTMLETKKTVSASAFRRAAVLPLIAGSIFIIAFSPQQAHKSAAIIGNKKITLVVDPGHGGKDDGCRYGSFVEKELNLKVAKRIKELAASFNVEVHLTRNDDSFLSLEERVNFSNKLHPDDFLSIHIDDQAGKETSKGTFDIAVNDKNAKADDSKRLAFAIYRTTSGTDWEQKSAASEHCPYVLRENTSAAVLIEFGDIKNKKQMAYIEDDAKLNELCSRILEGIVESHKK